MSQSSSSSSSQSEKRILYCFICEKNGFPNVQIVLKGKDQNGRTIYKEPDGQTPHQHRLKQGQFSQQQQQQQQQQQPAAAAATAISRQEFQQLESDIKDIKEMLVKYQTYYGDLVEFMHKLTIGQQQEKEKNERLAEQEYNYDRDKEDGII